MRLNKHTLEAFVEKSDALGGPTTAECKAFWQDLTYEPDFANDAQNDPFSERYMAQQMALYEEIAGHPYQDVRDEFTPGIPIQRLLGAPNAYDHASPSEYAKHCVALGLLVKELALPRGARILELGSGWGFCQEFLSQCGFETIGIDANPDFVATSNARLQRLGFGKRVTQARFDDISPDALGTFDAVIAYEAFHHAVDAQAVLGKAVACLRPGGVFALAGEPFNDFYSTWGLRRDCLSIYCIKKYGWFESGWSVEYMADVFGRCGLEATFIEMGISELTTFMIGRVSGRRRAFQLGMWHPEQKDRFYVDRKFISSRGSGKIALQVPGQTKFVRLNLVNFSKEPLAVELELEGQRRTDSFKPGAAVVEWAVRPAKAVHTSALTVSSELFCPADQGINADPRILGIHIESIDYMKEQL